MIGIDPGMRASPSMRLARGVCVALASVCLPDVAQGTTRLLATSSCFLESFRCFFPFYNTARKIYF
jgi:hypothetical protein